MKIKIAVFFSIFVVFLSSTAFARNSPLTEFEDVSVATFWTVNRVSTAKPRAFEQEKDTTNFVSSKNRLQGNEPEDLLETRWTNGGQIASNAGRVYFQMGPNLYFCSASVINDSVADRSLILTAAHCVYDESGGSGFATNWMFVPDYDADPVSHDGTFCDTTTLGCWSADAFVVPNRYASAGFFNETSALNDYAFVVVGAGGKRNSQLDTEVKGQTITFFTEPTHTMTWLFGYPVARTYQGDDLAVCSKPLSRKAGKVFSKYKVPCNMISGSSGGPWLKEFITDGPGTGTGSIFSVTSYELQNDGAVFGPIFNSDTAAMFVIAHETKENVLFSQP